MGDIADIVGGGTPSTNNADYWDGDIDWYAPAEIGDKIFVDSSERKITKEGFENCSAKLLPAGSVLFTSRAGIGKMAILRKESCTNQGFQSIVPHEGELDSYFIFSRSDELKNYGETVGAGSTFVEVSGKQMSNMNLMMPKSYSEQIVIGKYFSQLDDLITLHQRKYDKLQNIKKSMLEKMFPKNGSNVPEIRFSGFTDPWEQRKLIELTSVFTDGDWIEAKDQSDSGIRLVQTGNVGTTEYLDKINNAKWISEDTFQTLKCKEIYEGDILISRLPEPAGRACIMPNLGTKMITAVDCTIVRTNENNDSKFLVQYLSTPSYFKIVNTFLGGGTRQRISRNNLAEIIVPTPCNIAEQAKIGAYFSQLDHLITLHQRELEKLQNIKKSMLEKMFV